MKVAVHIRERDHYSVLMYRNALLPRLMQMGIECAPFTAVEGTPADCDLVWDPGLGMRSVPDYLFTTRTPIVVSVLGLRTFAVPIEDVSADEEQAARERQLKAQVLEGWRRLRDRLGAAITISHACAETIVSQLGVPCEKVYSVYLGVNRDVFKCGSERSDIPSDYLLHVSLDDLARKNMHRMLEAYESVPRSLRIPFLFKLWSAGAPRDIVLPEGARIVDRYMSELELAGCYHGARCLVFPSVYEGFGLPIVEAMASGCPVLTSNSSACSEVAGDSALLVDPLSTDSIAQGLKRILCDDELALNLSRKGLQRAKEFDWDYCATTHVKIFRGIAGHP